MASPHNERRKLNFPAYVLQSLHIFSACTGNVVAGDNGDTRKNMHTRTRSDMGNPHNDNSYDSWSCFSFIRLVVLDKCQNDATYSHTQLHLLGLFEALNILFGLDLQSRLVGPAMIIQFNFLFLATHSFVNTRLRKMLPL